VTLSHDRKLLASCSPDDIVKVIDVSHLHDRPKDGSFFDMDAYEKTLDHKANHGKVVVQQKKGEEEMKDSGDEWSSE